MQGRQQVLAQGKARVFRKFLMLIKERFLIVPEKIIKIPATHKAKPTTGSVNFYPQKTFCVSFRAISLCLNQKKNVLNWTNHQRDFKASSWAINIFQSSANLIVVIDEFVCLSHVSF